MKKIVILAVAVLSVGFGAFAAKALAGSANNAASCCAPGAACCPAGPCCK